MLRRSLKAGNYRPSSDSAEPSPPPSSPVYEGQPQEKPNISEKDLKNLLEKSTEFEAIDNPVTVANDFSSAPYPSHSALSQDLARYSHRPQTDPRDTSVILFPGQGSQFIGMGRELLSFPNVEAMYRMASDILGYDLLKLCLEGPKSELDKTVYCQPAVFVTSLAAIERLKHEQPSVSPFFTLV